MASHQELTDLENAHLRAALQRLLERYPSQRALARELGVTPTTVSAVLAGKTGASFGLARRMSEMLGVHVLSMLGGDALGRSGAIDPALLMSQLNGLMKRIGAAVEALGPEGCKAYPTAYGELGFATTELLKIAVTISPGGAAELVRTGDAGQRG